MRRRNYLLKKIHYRLSFSRKFENKRKSEDASTVKHKKHKKHKK